MNADLELQRNVKYNIYKALQRAAKLDCGRISVQTCGGNVILTGNARSLAERKDAEQAAWAAPGVSYVRNEIQIAGFTILQPETVH